MSCTKRNPLPPCNLGYIEKKTKKGINCCYKNNFKKCSNRNHIRLRRYFLTFPYIEFNNFLNLKFHI